MHKSIVLAVCWLAFSSAGAVAQLSVNNAELLRESGMIMGTVQCEGDAGGPAARALVYLLGESFMVKTDSGGDFALHYVPVGTYHLVVEVAGVESDPIIVQVKTKDATDVGPITVACGPTCTPTEEVCDQQDNDCDGEVDEDGVCEPEPTCGNGEVEEGEACDGADLAGETCITQGFTGGTLACSATCQFDLTGCTGCAPVTEVCDGRDNDCNGQVDDGNNLCSAGMTCVNGQCQ